MNNLISPVTYENTEFVSEGPRIKDEDLGLDLYHLVQQNNIVYGNAATPEKKSTKKNTKRKLDPDEVITDTESQRELKTTEMNIPYSETYKETTGMLKTVINQLDVGLSDMQSDVNSIRLSKTLKGKYNYLSLIQGNMSTFMGNKISAIREINSTISKANELELRRTKELKLNQEVDDDLAIMKAYQAYVNTPVGTSGYKPLAPDISSMSVMTGGIIGNEIGTSSVSYDDYMANITPAKRMMTLESNPDIQQVVLMDRATGSKSFEIMNMKTGEILNNVEKHDSMFLEDTTIDTRNNIARNINLNETYPVVYTGESVLNEY